jgi:energy-coupling factor transporter transmembrane protein EcfT
MKRIIFIILIIMLALFVIGAFVSWWLVFSIGLTILGTLGYLERAFGIRLPSKWVISLLILFVLLSFAYIVTGFIKSNHSEKKIAELSNLYSPIEDTASEHFPGLPREKAIKNYLGSISKIEADNKQLKEENLINKQQISELIIKTTQSQEIASQANRQATEANHIAEEERLARRKIETKLADRSLTDAQCITIANKVKSFSGQEFLITAYWDSKESLAIANRIASALNYAGWKYIPHERGSWLFGGVVGVLVYFNPTASERTKKAADILVSALKKEGIISELKQNNPGNVDNRININVGSKS